MNIDYVSEQKCLVRVDHKCISIIYGNKHKRWAWSECG